jgi:hypothetical protein
LGVLMRVVDRVVVLDHGEVIFSGRAQGSAGERTGDRGVFGSGGWWRDYAVVIPAER